MKRRCDVAMEDCGGRGRRARGAAAALLLASAFAGCLACVPAGQPAPRGAPAPPEGGPAAAVRRERAYLVDPLEGYAAAVDPSRRERIQRAWRGLVESGSVLPAQQAAAELLGGGAASPPAQVLAAQVDFVAGRYRAVVDQLLPVGDALPAYTASQLLLGRAAELLDDVPLAYAAFRAVAARNAKAFERAGELHPRALEMVSGRLQGAVRAGRLEDAGRQLALLQSWDPAAPATLEGARVLAVARGDRKAELAAIKGLAARRPPERQLLERRGELELEVGDPSAGLKIIQDLADRYRGDPALAEKLATAKWSWRLSLLPHEVRETAQKPELDRADLAVLLYWLVPEVRSARPTSGRIATDVLDHPRREEIVRVVNLGLMDVDPTLHRFSPSAPLHRGLALRAMARLLASYGRGIACLETGGVGQANVCQIAVACGLVDGDDACLPGETLSGADAVEIIRRGLRLLGEA
jgi:hypothetical protein